MKTINHIYVDNKNLKTFILEKGFATSLSVLVQVFVNNNFEGEISEIYQCIKKSIPNAVFLALSVKEAIYQNNLLPKAIISFTQFELTTLKIAYKENTDCFAMGQSIITDLYNENLKIVLLYSCDEVNCSDVIEGIKTNENKFIVVGALVPTVYTGVNEQHVKTIAVGLYGDSISAWSDTLCGWQEIGKQMTVTSCDKNLLLTLDDVDIIDIYKKFLGIEANDEFLGKIKFFPLRKVVNSLRLARAANKVTNNGIEFVSNFKKGEKLYLSYFNKQTWARIIKIVIDLYKNKNIQSCFAFYGQNRQEVLGDLSATELMGIDFVSESVSGFVSCGECFTSQDDLESYVVSGSCTLLLLTENNETNVKKGNEKEIDNLFKNINVLDEDILTNFFNKSTDEIDHEIDVKKQSHFAIIEQDRLASIGQLFGGVAHNINTPLTSIMGCAIIQNKNIAKLKELLKRNDIDKTGELIDSIVQNIGNIKEQVLYISEVMNTVKNQIRSNENLNPQDFTPEELMKKVLMLTIGTLKDKRIDLKISIKDEVSKIEFSGEISILIQVLINLIDNSIDSYNGESGVIEINIYKERVGHGIYPYMAISVRDYGCGIPDSIKKDLFKKMVTTKGTNGTGIGLYISSLLLKAKFNADISLISEESKGTNMYILVPFRNN